MPGLDQRPVATIHSSHADYIGVGGGIHWQRRGSGPADRGNDDRAPRLHLFDWAGDDRVRRPHQADHDDGNTAAGHPAERPRQVQRAAAFRISAKDLGHQRRSARCGPLHAAACASGAGAPAANPRWATRRTPELSATPPSIRPIAGPSIREAGASRASVRPVGGGPLWKLMWFAVNWFPERVRAAGQGRPRAGGPRKRRR